VKFLSFIPFVLPLTLIPGDISSKQIDDLSLPGHVHNERIEFINCEAVRYL
tara:strand:- start:1260 stop:1412 length:153 start_codon:yes stop_codon:yes gene_type:complete